MTGFECCDPTCRYCGVEIMFIGALWLKRNRRRERLLPQEP
jgi:hypothetical protein